MTEEIVNIEIELLKQSFRKILAEFDIACREIDIADLQEEIINLKIVELCRTGK